MTCAIRMRSERRNRTGEVSVSRRGPRQHERPATRATTTARNRRAPGTVLAAARLRGRAAIASSQHFRRPALAASTAAHFYQRTNDRADHVIEESVGLDFHANRPPDAPPPCPARLTGRAFAGAGRHGDGPGCHAWLEETPVRAGGVMRAKLDRDPLDGKLEHGAHARLARRAGRLETAEVVRADQPLGGPVHGVRVEPVAIVPGVPQREHVAHRRVVDHVAVALAHGAADGVEIVGRQSCVDDGHVARQLGVQRPCEHVRRQPQVGCES